MRGAAAFSGRESEIAPRGRELWNIFGRAGASIRALLAVRKRKKTRNGDVN